MDDDSIVYVWHDGTGWEPTPAHEVVCPECGGSVASGELWWETVIAHEPHLQCECGEQFSTKSED
jgi:hypothetical protein